MRETLGNKYPVNGVVDTKTAGPGFMYVWLEGDASGVPIAVAHDDELGVDEMDGCVPVNQIGLPPIVAQAFVVGNGSVREVGVVGFGDDEVSVNARQVPVGFGFVNMGTGVVGVRPMPRTQVGGRLHGQDFPEKPVGDFLNEAGGIDPTALQESAGRWSGRKQTPVTLVYGIGGEAGLPKREDDLVKARGGSSGAVIDGGRREDILRKFREARVGGSIK